MTATSGRMNRSDRGDADSVLHLLVVDPHQRADPLAEHGTKNAKPVGDEAGPDAQPRELITGPDA
jgi:hypothetical protein